MSFGEADVSPEIGSVSWGKVNVVGYQLAFKDVKLFPGGVRDWDWRETGTRHSPGIQMSDIHELLEHGAKIVVLSRGMEGALKIHPNTISELDEKGIEVYQELTSDCVSIYNKLALGGRKVGALLHSTC